MSSNENWEEFKERLFGSPYMIWHDGPDVDAGKLSREDPAHLRKMLLDGLDYEDYVALEALKVVEMPEIIPDLREHLKKVKGKFKIELAAYLQEKDTPPDDRYARVLINEIEHPSYIMIMDAAILLRNFPLEYVRDIIFRVITEHPDYYMRYHAADSFLKLVGKTNGILDPQYNDIFLNIVDGKDGKNGEADFERFKNAAEMLKALE